MAKKRRKGRHISPVKVIWVWAVSWGLWLIFAADLDWREALIGFVAAGIACFATMLVAHEEKAGYKFRLNWVLEIIWVPWCVLDGTYQVLRGLANQLFTRRGADSFLGAVRFTVGGHTERAAGRRALAVTFTTATPNFVIIGIDHKQRLMLYHQVLRGKVLKLTQNLGARP